MDNRIHSGSGKVLDSGLVFQFFNNPIVFNLDLPEFPLKVILNFYESETQRIDTNRKNEYELELNLYNFNSSSGTHLKRPVMIANYNNQDTKLYIYISFQIVKPSDESNRFVAYTFFLSEENL